jgi:two-component system LytT family response regulator
MGGREVLRALIIDDEPSARSELRYLLNKTGEVEVVGEAASASEGWEILNSLDYDVVFVDIKMPGLTGLDLANKIRSLKNPPQVVFVTAYNEHALEAFEVEAIDYLVKPFSEERLYKTLARLERRREGEKKGLPKFERIVVEKDGKKLPIAPQDVYFFEARDDYAMLYTYEQKFLLSSTLKELEKKLSHHHFLRVHRKYLVNLEKIGEIIPLSRSTYLLRMKDKVKSEILVSRRKAKELREVLEF